MDSNTWIHGMIPLSLQLFLSSSFSFPITFEVFQAQLSFLFERVQSNGTIFLNRSYKKNNNLDCPGSLNSWDSQKLDPHQLGDIVLDTKYFLFFPTWWTGGPSHSFFFVQYTADMYTTKQPCVRKELEQVIHTRNRESVTSTCSSKSSCTIENRKK